jgi:hypothetical protein
MTETKGRSSRRSKHPSSAIRHLESEQAYPALLPVSQGYSGGKGTFPRVTHPSAAQGRSPALDLHVLSLPPAFVLSQDQTLKLKGVLLVLPRFALLEDSIPFLTDEPLHIAPTLSSRSPNVIVRRASVPEGNRRPTNGEADTRIIGVSP